MCSYIQRGAFANQWLAGRREYHIDCEVLQPMQRVCNQMKRTTGFVARNGSMVIDGELTRQARRENRVDGPPMKVICCPVAMVGFGMNMDQRRGEHPYRGPYEDHGPKPRDATMHKSHGKPA
jgi:hypothetical protein